MTSFRSFFTFAALLLASTAQAQFYAGITLGRSTSAAPDFQNTELVDASNVRGNSEALLFGYRFASRRFVEFAVHKLPDARSSYFSGSGGTGITSIYQENVTQHTDMLTLLAGLPLAKLGIAEVSALIGAHYYEQRTYRFSRLEQYEEKFGNEIIDRVLRANLNDTGIGLAAGIGLAVPVSPRLNLIGRAVYLGKVKHTTLEFGATFSF